MARASSSSRAWGTAARHEHLLTVGQWSGEVQRGKIGLARRTAGTRDGVGDAHALPQPVDAGPAHRARHVDDQLRPRRVRRRRRRAQRRHDGRRMRAAEVPQAEPPGQDDDRDRRHEPTLARRERVEIHAVILAAQT